MEFKALNSKYVQMIWRELIINFLFFQWLLLFHLALSECMQRIVEIKVDSLSNTQSLSKTEDKNLKAFNINELCMNESFAIQEFFNVDGLFKLRNINML